MSFWPLETSTAILFGAIFATVGWMHTSRAQRRADRRNHTYSIIIRHQDDSQFHDALKVVRETLEADNIPSPDDKERRSDIIELDYFLNTYEFLAAAIWCGDFDESLLKYCEYTRVTKLFRKMTPYIESCRKYRDQPTMFENLETLADRWEHKNSGPLERLYEWATMRPCRASPSWIIWGDNKYKNAVVNIRKLLKLNSN